MSHDKLWRRPMETRPQLMSHICHSSLLGRNSTPPKSKLQRKITILLSRE